ncbi:MAG TPA: polysaccharide deacetylase family protein [Bacteroidales bacterium]|nr:polysaccharide deacetylase family protein [Bacteroidales bacterium]HRX97870.1 polysaccharide deacetylase family protein [Bacteroidales bacterium]
MKKPFASISLDLDNQWSYMKIHGDEGWDKYPSYFDIFVPHVLNILDDLKIKITFFIVGKDASIEFNKPYLHQIIKRGHELGNHSFNHESWLQKYSHDEIVKEINDSHQILSDIAGELLVGFRGPGFSWSPDLLEVLSEKGYIYDASTLPTWIGPLARKYYFMTSGLSKEERKDRSELFGKFSDGLRSNKPYTWNLNNGKNIFEIPVSVIPVLRVPFHLSYLLYLSGFSMALMKLYLNIAIGFCKMTGTEPSFLLHPLDLVGGDQIKELAFFPGMQISSERKTKVFKEIISALSKHFELVNMSTFAHDLNNRRLKNKSPYAS